MTAPSISPAVAARWMAGGASGTGIAPRWWMTASIGPAGQRRRSPARSSSRDTARSRVCSTPPLSMCSASTCSPAYSSASGPARRDHKARVPWSALVAMKGRLSSWVSGKRSRGSPAGEWATSTVPETTWSYCISSRPSEVSPVCTTTEIAPALAASTAVAQGEMKSVWLPWDGGM